MDLFNELLNTALDQAKGLKITASTSISFDAVPALHYLSKLADNETIIRCLSELQKQRKNEATTKERCNQRAASWTFWNS